MVACLSLILMPLAGCSPDSLVGPVTDGGSLEAPAAAGSGQVTELAVTAATDSSVTLAWTDVEHGTGRAALYQLKYAQPPIDWSRAAIGCDRTMSGAVGGRMSCTILGLAEGTRYDFQLMTYRTGSGAWAGAVYSSVVTGSTTGAPTSHQTAARGIWVSKSDLMQRPTSGADWNALVQDAASSTGAAAIADQDSKHDVGTLAAALVCVRTGEHCDKARRGVLDAIGTENGARWLAVGRNLGGYVIAADLLDLRAGASTGRDGERVQQWMEGWLTKRLRDNNGPSVRPFIPFRSAANAAAQEGFAYAAVAAYLGDRDALDRAWDAFRRYVCAPGAPDRERINMRPSMRDDWTDASTPCSVNPKGSVRRVPPGRRGAGGAYRLDGSLPGDMRRGGVFQWTPGFTPYPWVGLEGLVPAALILERAGYPAFDVADRAVLRTHEYLWWLRNAAGDARWFDGVRAREIVHLVNRAYDKSFPVDQVVGGGRTVGYTGWTHPR